MKKRDARIRALRIAANLVGEVTQDDATEILRLALRLATAVATEEPEVKTELLTIADKLLVRAIRLEARSAD